MITEILIKKILIHQSLFVFETRENILFIHPIIGASTQSKKLKLSPFGSCNVQNIWLKIFVIAIL